MDEARVLGGGRVRQIPSPYGAGGETGYTVQEDPKSINSYNMGGGNKGLVFPFLLSENLLDFICSFILESSQIVSQLKD